MGEILFYLEIYSSSRKFEFLLVKKLASPMENLKSLVNDMKKQCILKYHIKN